MSAATISRLSSFPVKGFPAAERLTADLTAGAWFPDDRIFAFEVGDSGFDPLAPRHVPKMRFAVLARFPSLARIRLAYLGDGDAIMLTLPDGGRVRVGGGAEADRYAAHAIHDYLADPGLPPLRLLQAPPSWSFSDHHMGYVSLIDLSRLRALERATGISADPLRFRANGHVDGGLDIDALPVGAVIRTVGVTLEVVAPIERCRATDVDPDRGVRDTDMATCLREAFGQTTFGIYCRVVEGGRLSCGDVLNIA
jgi:hypothetical protein